ncbi:protocadherin beta-11-like [Sinocyclocheilus grahami]|uniref:protocadherin beta-11-like n=1 Tax=Sinocyclocheilus grahami TaxID=75366 RepID=UPI0007AC7C89|nr:PREDICTED: protocadherin beta-11-like [Sinocyclocheilus grahami]
MSDRTMARQVLLFIWFLSLSSALGQVSYSIPEEMAKGSLVGSIAQDLGLDLKRLRSGKARIYTGDSAEYIELNKERGVLLIKERIDRETLCGQTTPCALHFQIILENPMQLYRVTVEIQDINDNAPIFSLDEMKFEISEMALSGAKFDLETAVDTDVGLNGLQKYILKPSDNFIIKTQSLPDGSKSVEMVLQKPPCLSSPFYVGGTGTLQHVYNYEVCRTTDSRKSDLKYDRPCSESIISLDSSGAQTLTHAQRGKLISDEFDDQFIRRDS